MSHFKSEQPHDEGYSEHPLTTPPKDTDFTALAALQSPAHITQWLSKYASYLPLHVRHDLTAMLLENLPTSSIAEIVESLHHRLYIDFVRYLPPEICLKVLGYLDALTLISVMKTCRAWHDLALDRRLWHRLYHIEGWKSIPAEIQNQGEKFNSELSRSTGRPYPMEDETDQEEHSIKRRALESSPEDAEIADSGRFGAGKALPYHGTSSRIASATAADMDMDMSSIVAKGKGTDLESEQSSSSAKRKGPMDEIPPDTVPFPSVTSSSARRSSLWVWDGTASEYRINWKYLYDMRLKLETNWEHGRFTNFQLPHPDFPEEGHADCIYTLQFDRDYIVSGSRDKTMRIWSMHTKRLTMPPLTGHTASVLCLQYNSDPSEDLLVSGSSDSHVFIWQFSTGKLLQKIKAHNEPVLNVRFDDRVLVTSSKDKTIKIFNRRPLKYGDAGYAPDDSMVDSVAINLKRYGHDPSLADELPVKPAYTMIGRLKGHSAAVNAIQVLGDNVISVSGDRNVKVWNWPGQYCSRTIPAHTKGIACVEYDGRRIVSGSSDYEVCVFDASTGLKVATLRGHMQLVRTIQAGFGDLPYSKFEDEAEARAKDEDTFRSFRRESQDSEEMLRSYHRRRRQDSTSDTAKVQSIGAKLPPGGGGSKRYGRIVSGSYDHTIIIWRRDNKEGAWRPAHQLRPTDAAEAARRDANEPRSTSGRRLGSPSSAHPSVGHGAPAPFGYNVSHDEGDRRLPPPGLQARSLAMPDPLGRRSQRRANHFHQALIEQSTSQGPTGLRAVLMQHPDLLLHQDQLQERISREPSPMIRNQLALVLESVLWSYRRRSRRAHAHAQNHINSQTTNASSAAGPPTSTAAMAGSESSTNTVRAEPTSLSTEPEASQAQAPQIQATEVHESPPRAQGPFTQAEGHARTAISDQLHHPHIPEETGGRIFKVQFDARRLMCCSQATTIVGWDFCDGDAELEEASKYFATLD